MEGVAEVRIEGEGRVAGIGLAEAADGALSKLSFCFALIYILII